MKIQVDQVLDNDKEANELRKCKGRKKQLESGEAKENVGGTHFSAVANTFKMVCSAIQRKHITPARRIASLSRQRSQICWTSKTHELLVLCYSHVST